MPIEIRELHIKGVITDKRERPEESLLVNPQQLMEKQEEWVEKIVALCVERFLEIQEEKTER